MRLRTIPALVLLSDQRGGGGFKGSWPPCAPYLRCPVFIHSKNIRFRVTWKKGPLGSYSVPSQKLPEIWSAICRLDKSWGQIGPALGLFRVKLTDFRVIVDQEWSLAPKDPFPGHADPGVFREYLMLVIMSSYFKIGYGYKLTSYHQEVST